jgi:hypothetical protein
VTCGYSLGGRVSFREEGIIMKRACIVSPVSKRVSAAGPVLRGRLTALALSLLLGGAAVGFAAMPAAYASVPRDNTATVCSASAKSVTEGLKTFRADVQRATGLAAKGDHQRADAAVKDAGGSLVTLAGNLRKDAANADDASLRSSVNDLATQLETQGRSLTSLSSLQNLKATRLHEAIDKVAKACHSTSGPSGHPSRTG